MRIAPTSLRPISAVDYFLRSSRRVEPPSAIGFHNRNGQRPVIRSHIQHQMVAVDLDELMFCVVSVEKLVQLNFVGIRVARTDDPLAAGAENGGHRRLVLTPERVDQRGEGLLGRCEHFLRGHIVRGRLRSVARLPAWG